MASIRSFIQAHLLAPLKQYPTKIQDTMIEIISQRLEEVYNYATRFPEIISPNKSRLDILKVIADQFLFTVREDADIEEQIAILDKILYVYRKRGSIDTIENMWKYYGGTLPKDVQVIIPSYNLFRYSKSRLSGTHVFQDNQTNRSGVYEIRLINNTYPIPDLKEFLLKELVAAGNYIYFTNSLHLDLTSVLTQNNHYNYIVYEDSLIEIQEAVLKSNSGFMWSGVNSYDGSIGDSAWSGRSDIYLELMYSIEFSIIDLSTYYPIDIELAYSKLTDIVRYIYDATTYKSLLLDLYSYSTPTDSSPVVDRHLYIDEDDLGDVNFPGYFILSKTPLS